MCGLATCKHCGASHGRWHALGLGTWRPGSSSRAPNEAIMQRALGETVMQQQLQQKAHFACLQNACEQAGEKGGSNNTKKNCGCYMQHLFTAAHACRSMQ